MNVTECGGVRKGNGNLASMDIKTSEEDYYMEKLVAHLHIYLYIYTYLSSLFHDWISLPTPFFNNIDFQSKPTIY